MKKHDGREIQRYALNPEGQAVDVRTIREKGSYICPACHDAMIPKMGKIREWHFAHKTQVCSYESYLHSLAKIRIAQWFNESPSILLDLEAFKICADYGNCAFYYPLKCERPTRVQHDLKKFYPECAIEQPYGGFIPDILCPHPKSPLFLEVFVSHECTEEKKRSGQRIIEFNVSSEEDIDRIVYSPIIRESEKVKFYGFRQNQIFCGGFKRRLFKYVLYRSGKSFVVQENVDCRNYGSPKPGAIYEMTAGTNRDPVMMFLVGKSMAHRDGYLPKDCSICFWLGGKLGARICKLYKKCGNPMLCKDNDARKCRMFRPNRELIEECARMGEKWQNDCSSIWHARYKPGTFN